MRDLLLDLRLIRVARFRVSGLLVRLQRMGRIAQGKSGPS
jgi:hypothetical protein